MHIQLNQNFLFYRSFKKFPNNKLGYRLQKTFLIFRAYWTPRESKYETFFLRLHKAIQWVPVFKYSSGLQYTPYLPF